MNDLQTEVLIQDFLLSNATEVPADICCDDALSGLALFLATDQPIDVVERLELVYKAILLAYSNAELDGHAMRRIAAFQKQIGPILKYKSYTVKACTPLGHSIFLHEPQQGFSFQRHVEHKTEAFRIVDVQPGGYVFFCSYEDWRAIYEPESFGAWLLGADIPRYEPYRYRPEPGDVFVMDDLNIVHTVIGCNLEEFATVSTDMVDRLHDQNQSRPMPAHFTGRLSRSRLLELRPPVHGALVGFDHEGWSRSPLPREAIEGGHRVTLADTTFTASDYAIDPGACSQTYRDPKRWGSLYVWQGTGRLAIGEEAELSSSAPPCLDVTKGDTLMVPPSASYRFINDGPSALQVSEHRISATAAFHA